MVSDPLYSTVVELELGVQYSPEGSLGYHNIESWVGGRSKVYPNREM